MANTNPLTISYGSQEFGGESAIYQLSGAYVIEKTYSTLRISFDVQVVADDVADLQARADVLETALAKRDQDLVISLGGNSWSYTSGTKILNTIGNATKSGNRETDRGASRLYTCTVQGELPAADRDGLRDFEVHVDFGTNRRRLIAMRGVYTATTTGRAVATYLSKFDAEANTLLTAIAPGVTFELVDESYTRDRNDFTCSFSRQYSQIIYDQSTSLDEPAIVDHRVVFTCMQPTPGDSRVGIYRLRRVIASFDCTLRIDSGTSGGPQPKPETVWDTIVKQFLNLKFIGIFNPKVYGIEDVRLGYDQTSCRLSATVQYLFQPQEAGNIVEISESVAVRENRTIDYTPIHSGGEFDFEVDQGWTVRERISNRTLVIIGNEPPRSRIGAPDPQGGTGGSAPGAGGGSGPGGLSTSGGVFGTSSGSVSGSGWNVVSNTSQSTRMYIGDPSGQQIEHTVINETVVERFSNKPGGDNNQRIVFGGATQGF